MSPKESKEMQLILSKINDGMDQCFKNLGNLFYNREESELKDLTAKKIELMKNYCQKFDEIKEKSQG